MRDTGDFAFLKVPPAAAYDRRLRGFDLQILLALVAHADFSTMETDHSGVQLAQDFNVTRPSIVRALGRLVQFGYLEPRGFSSRHGRRYRIRLDNPLPPVPSVAQSGDATCTTGDTSPVPPVAHSSELSQKEKQQGGKGRPTSRPSSYWEQPLAPSDFEPGTELVVAARDLGFARDEGAAKDALQAQRAGFFSYRSSRGYTDAPKRSDFHSWLRTAAKKRAAYAVPAEKNSAPGAAEIANDARPVPANFRAGLPTTWHQPYRDALAALVKAHGRAAVVSWFHEAILERGADGGAVLVVPRDVTARNIEARYLADLREAFTVAPLTVRSAKKRAA